MAESFRPAVAETVSISVGASSNRVQFQQTGSTGTSQVRIHNDGSATAWISFGDETITATIPSGATKGSMPIPAGAVEVLTEVGTHVAAIAAGSTGSIYFTPGQGI